MHGPGNVTMPASLEGTRSPVDAPRCGWCGASARPAGTRLVACESCGAATTYPPPSDAELEAAYATWYRPDSGRFSGPGDRLLRRSRATLATRIDRRAPAGPVLDVGSGDGVLLDALRARGRDALGLERAGSRPDRAGSRPDRAGSRPDHASSRPDHAGSRPDVRIAELTAFDERPGEWAAIVMWHSLEHLRDAPAALDRACELLAPHGLLIVAVPNRASWQARAFGDRWLALDLPRHLIHLTANALLQRVRARGLRTERVSYWRGGQVVFGWLHGLVAALPGHPNLYDAIRQPAAQSTRTAGGRRVATLSAGTVALPLALGLAAAEIAAGAGGTVCVEARKP
jgi:SAM-dependent methyltransferase